MIWLIEFQLLVSVIVMDVEVDEVGLDVLQEQRRAEKSTSKNKSALDCRLRIFQLLRFNRDGLVASFSQALLKL